MAALLTGCLVLFLAKSFLRAAAAEDGAHRLAIVVPLPLGVHLDLAVSSMKHWPSQCSALTMQNTDLVLYFNPELAGEDPRYAAGAADAIADSALGRWCFSETRAVHGQQEVRPRCLRTNLERNLFICVAYAVFPQ